MQTVYRFVLALHVLGGAAGLLSLLFPLIAKKGARLHKASGWVFTAGMGLSASTGIALAGSWLLAPAIFQPEVSPPQARLDGTFLLLIGALTGNALIQAISAVRRKRESARPGAFTRSSLALLALVALASVVLGLLYDHVLSIVFGLGSLALVRQDVLFTFRPLPSPMAWW